MVYWTKVLGDDCSMGVGVNELSRITLNTFLSSICFNDVDFIIFCDYAQVDICYNNPCYSV